MSILAPVCAFALGFCAGVAGGIVLGFVWYERKCGLFSDRSGKRAAAIWSELDDVALARGEYSSSTRVAVNGRSGPSDPATSAKA
jgi:hypothetical protein